MAQDEDQRRAFVKTEVKLLVSGAGKGRVGGFLASLTGGCSWEVVSVYSFQVLCHPNETKIQMSPTGFSMGYYEKCN